MIWGLVILHIPYTTACINKYTYTKVKLFFIKSILHHNLLNSISSLGHFVIIFDLAVHFFTSTWSDCGRVNGLISDLDINRWSTSHFLNDLNFENIGFPAQIKIYASTLNGFPAWIRKYEKHYVSPLLLFVWKTSGREMWRVRMIRLNVVLTFCIVRVPFCEETKCIFLSTRTSNLVLENDWAGT